MPSGYHIITDSCSDLSPQFAKSHGIEILPFRIVFGEKEYKESVDLTPQMFYDLCTKSPYAPKTSQILQHEFYERFKSCGIYSDVIAVLICGKGSGTLSNAQKALRQIREEGLCPDTRFHILDSRGYSLLYGYPVIEAAKKLAAGKSVHETVAYLNDFFSSAEIYLLAYDLKFMKKSGRISAAAAFLGELMGFRPIISLIDGVSKVEMKCRGEKALMSEAVKLISGRANPETPWLLVRAVMTEQENIFSREFSEAVKSKPAMEGYIGCAVGANTGPKAIGIVIKGKKRD